jgi:hypothetical protein
MLPYSRHRRSPASIRLLRLYVPLPFHLTILLTHPLAPTGNSNVPQFLQTERVNIYLISADRTTVVNSWLNQRNPRGQAGDVTWQVDDSWFPDNGTAWNGQNLTYPFYFVITRNDVQRTGTEPSQAIFNAVRKSLLLSFYLSLFLFISRNHFRRRCHCINVLCIRRFRLRLRLCLRCCCRCYLNRRTQLLHHRRQRLLYNRRCPRRLLGRWLPSLGHRRYHYTRLPRYRLILRSPLFLLPTRTETK